MHAYVVILSDKNRAAATNNVDILSSFEVARVPLLRLNNDVPYVIMTGYNFPDVV